MPPTACQASSTQASGVSTIQHFGRSAANFLHPLRITVKNHEGSIGTEGIRLLREKRSRGPTARGKRVPVVEIGV
ncbi:hypothetical protein CHI08_23325 [Peribacillus simplex]|nr:hypothetical protein CHI08_23325 [Peribacillus simplex]